MSYSKPIKYILSLAGAALLLYFSFKGVRWDAFLNDLQSCRWGYVILAMAASILAFFFRSQRWRCLLQPFDPDMQRLTAFNGVNIGYLANFVFPRIGEIVRCGFIHRRSLSRHKDNPEKAVNFDQAIGTVLLSRCWDVLVIFLLLILLLSARWQMFGDFFVRSMWTPFLSRFNVNLWLLAALLLLIVALALFLIWHFRASSPFCAKCVSFVKGIVDGFRGFAKMKRKKAFLAYTVLLWAMYWLMSMCSIWAVPQMDGLGWIDGWFICLAGSVAWMIPVPGGFGSYHGIVALALSSIYSFTWSDGLLCATLNHEAQAVTMLLCGIISYIIEVARK